MRRRTDRILICACFGAGAYLSLSLMPFLFGVRIYSDFEWRFAAPGWWLFRLPSGNPFGDFIYTTFDTVVFGGTLYILIRGLVWLYGRDTYP